MLPFQITTLEATYKAFRAYYITKYTLGKFETLYSKIATSTNLSKLVGESIRLKVVPSVADYINTIATIPYFLFGKGETRALGILIAIRLWNERVNKIYNLTNTAELDRKTLSVFKHLSLY